MVVSSLPPTDNATSVDLATLIALRQEAGRLPIAPRGKVLATRSGGHLSRFRGRGMEFDESRVYMPGDDPRRPALQAAARIHAEAGIANVSAEHYEGSHWLASFATYLVTRRGLAN